MRPRNILLWSLKVTLRLASDHIVLCILSHSYYLVHGHLSDLLRCRYLASLALVWHASYIIRILVRVGVVVHFYTRRLRAHIVPSRGRGRFLVGWLLVPTTIQEWVWVVILVKKRGRSSWHQYFLLAQVMWVIILDTVCRLVQIKLLLFKHLLPGEALSTHVLAWSDLRLIGSVPKTVHIMQKTLPTLSPNFALHCFAQTVHHAIGTFAANWARSGSLMSSCSMLRSHFIYTAMVN